MCCCSVEFLEQHVSFQHNVYSRENCSVDHTSVSNLQSNCDTNGDASIFTAASRTDNWARDRKSLMFNNMNGRGRTEFKRSQHFQNCAINNHQFNQKAELQVNLSPRTISHWGIWTYIAYLLHLDDYAITIKVMI